jgi:HK97 family phage portal protein
MPKGGVQTSLAGMVSQITAAFRRKGGATPGKGAPIASYPDNASGGPVLGQGDMTQFAPVFQPSGGFFAPGYPLVPPEPERLRLYDFPSGYNYIYTPRSFEPVGFPELRALAQAHDITRLCIETRKDQIEALDWTIKSRDEKNPKADADDRIKTLTQFWRKPDGITPFATWLRELLEDLLVLDAPTLDVRINRAGEIIALELVDGATIKVLIDDTGRRPLPPAPAFEQVIHGRPWVLTEDGRVNTELRGKPIFGSQLMYLPRNPRTHKPYGMSPVEQVIMTVNIGLRRQVMQLQHFTEGNVPAGMATAPDGWNADQIAHYQEWFDSMLGGNTAWKTRIIWGPAGAKYQAFKEAPYKDEFDEWLARIVCYAFSLPPTAFVKQVNRATAGTAQEVAIEEGLAPIMSWVKRLCDAVIQDRMGHTDLEFGWLDVRPVDPKDQADILTEYVKNGVYTLNEARDALGMDPVEGGDLPMIVTTQGPVLLKNIEALGEQQLNPPAPPPRPGEANGQGAPGAEPAPSSDGAGKPGKGKGKNNNKPGVAKAGASPFGDNGPPPYVQHARHSLRHKLTDFLHAEAPRVARELLTAHKASNDQRNDQPVVDQPEIPGLVTLALANIDFDRWTALTGDLEPDLVAVAKGTIADTLTELGITPTEEQLAEFDTWAREWAAERAEQLITLLTGSTPGLLRTDLEDALGEHLTVEELAAQLARTGAFSEIRAARIADYETINAYHAATLQAFKVGGVKTVVWVTMQDDLVEEICEENEDDGPIEIGQVFSSGDERPPAHNNCRCWLEPGDDDEGETVTAVAKAGWEDVPRDDHGKWETSSVGKIELTKTKDRAWTGKPTAIENKPSKAETGALGERIAVAYLQSSGLKDAAPLHVQAATNFPLDLIGDHELYEVKTGVASSQTNKWRATLGEPGPSEKAYLKTADAAEKAAWNKQKLSAALERKADTVRQFSEHLGRNIQGKTIGVILNPDTRTADVHVIDGFHAAVGWNSAMAKSSYVGSFRYKDG